MQNQNSSFNQLYTVSLSSLPMSITTMATTAMKNIVKEKVLFRALQA